MKQLHLKGIIPPILTPLRRDGSVDTLALERLTQHLIKNGVHALFALGTAGEGPVLTHSQRRTALETIKSAVQRAVPLLVGILETSTERYIEVVKEVEKVGVDAVVVNPPFYFPVSQEEIVKHVLKIREATDLPLVLYNIPKYTGNPYTAETVHELAKVPGVIAYKDSSSDMVHFQEVLRLTKDMEGFSVLQGNHLLSIPSLLMGAAGLVPGLGNIIPKEMVELYNAVIAGDLPTAYRCHELVVKLDKLLAGDHYSLAMLKAMIEVLGFSDECVPHTPLPPLDNAMKTRLREFFAREQITGWAPN